MISPPQASVLITALLAVLQPISAWTAQPHTITVDFGSSEGRLRPLHGINKGPLSSNGLIDVTKDHKRLHIPFTRLHDCHHPNPDVVDIHTIFPNADADPERAESYDFRATDAYLAAVHATGAEVVYRLGESIEHQPIKRHVHPPADPARWAAVCAGIVRHYNHGWAGGFRYNIRYWEIWNEPENRPVMWTGDDAQFLELYKVAARTLRAEFPGIKIGGPGFGHCGKFDGRDLEPSAFCTAFLELCRRESLPLDFFSWHCYTDNPAELAARAKAVRKLLQAWGFDKTESHLNEWNYLPGNSWDVLSRTAPAATRQRAVEQMAGAPGAAFLAGSLIELQDAPVDVANFYHGECGIFGMFTEVGAPVPCYYGLLAFSELMKPPNRVLTTGGIAGKLAAAAGTSEDRTKASLLISNLSGPAAARVSLSSLPWEGGTQMEIRTLDGAHDFGTIAAPEIRDGTFTLNLPPPAVALISLNKGKQPAGGR